MENQEMSKEQKLEADKLVQENNKDEFKKSFRKGIDFDCWKEDDNIISLTKKLIKESLEKTKENNKFIVKFADNTEFDITKGFSVEELIRIDYGLFLIGNEEDKKLKDKIGFLINMKLNYNKKNDTNNI